MTTANASTLTVVDTVRQVIAETSHDIREQLHTHHLEEPQRRDASVNPSGERQTSIDVWADELLRERIGDIDGVGSYASEERETVLETGTGVSVCVDPLDGSSNLDSNNPTGTIFGVYDADLPARGRELLGAGYVLYGPTTTMVSAVENSVRIDAIVDGTPQEVEAGPTLPADPVVYGFGGRTPEWTDWFREYAGDVQAELKCRYSGALVADINQVVTYGGVFAYPALESRANGKLRLLFEGNPISYLIEAAGGRSSDGCQSILDREATELHQRVPLHVGNRALVERVERRNPES